jgi:hypothetical protein
VINIHTENLNEITRRLGTKTVEMLILPITNYPTVISEARPNPRANQTNDDTFLERHIIQKLAFALVTDPRSRASGSISNRHSIPRNPAK